MQLAIDFVKFDKETQRKILLAISGTIIGIVASYTIIPQAIEEMGYKIGLVNTPSIFKKVVVYKTKDFSVKKNRMYVFLFPKDTPYYKKDQEFVKYVKCLAGDKLEVKGLSFYCNGEFIATARTTDSKGKPVKHFIYNGVIPKGKVFMYAPHYRSYDSRYWGLLDLSRIKGEVKWSL